MADDQGLDILAIAAHPDDVEITCGGFLIKMSKAARRVGVLDLTGGEMGTLGGRDDRSQEADRACEIMGLAMRLNAGLPDSALDMRQEYKLRIAQFIRDTQPELVLLPHWEQRHPDHRIACQLGYDACFLAGLKKIDLTGEPFRPHKIAYVSYFRNTEYSFLVDVSDEMDAKCEAVRAYHSQFGDKITAKQIFQPGLDIYDLMRTRARQLGQLAGVEYAEAYSVKEPILIDDPQKMPVRSV